MHLRPALLALTLAATSGIGCSLTPTVTLEVPEAEAESAISMEALAGSWTIEASVWSDCPTEWQRPMPTGKTHWAMVEDHLVITPEMSHIPPAELWPINGTTFTRTMDVSFFGCTATEALTLIIDEASDSLTSGLYSAQMTHDGSDACQDMTDEAGLPESCETIMEWRARRIGGR